MDPYYPSHNLAFTNVNWHNSIAPGTPFTVRWNDTLYSGILSLATVETEAIGDGQHEWAMVEMITSNLTSTTFTWIPGALNLSSLYVLILDDGTQWTYSPTWRPTTITTSSHLRLHSRIATSQSQQPTNSSIGDTTTNTDNSSIAGPTVGIVAAGILLSSIIVIAMREHKQSRIKLRREEEQTTTANIAARRTTVMDGGEEEERGETESVMTLVDYEDPVVYPEPVHVRRGREREREREDGGLGVREGGGVDAVEEENSDPGDGNERGRGRK